MSKKGIKQRQPEPHFPNRFYIIGADQSLKRPGFCKMLIDTSNGGYEIQEFALTNVNNKNKTKPHGQQLDEVLKEMAFFFPDVEKENCPAFFVREKAALSSFSQAMIGQAKMAGMADWMLWRIKQQWEELAPNAVKMLVAGNGKADKEKVAECLKIYVGERAYKCDDESDATAVAIAFLIKHGVISKINDASAQSGDRTTEGEK